MTVYVSLPQIPLTLKFEESFGAVADHFQELVSTGSVHRYEFAEGQSVVVNYAVVACLTISEGHRTLEVSELHRGLQATITPVASD